MSKASSFIRRRGEDAVLYKRNLGGRDAETGWPTVTWDTEVVRVITKFVQSREIDTPSGRATEERRKFFFTNDAKPKHRDKIVYRGETYELETETYEQWQSEDDPLLWILRGKARYRFY